MSRSGVESNVLSFAVKSMASIPRLSVVIASYNEEKRLPATLARLEAYFQEAKISHEFVIVNDGSIDGTIGVAEEFGLSTGAVVKVYSHFPNHGRGASIREGMLAATGDFVLDTDADCSVDPEAIGRFIQQFEKEPELDVLFGSRMMKGAKITYQQPPLRIFMGYGFLYLTRFMFWSWRTTDFALGFKMLRRAAAQDVFQHQYDNHFTAEAEIVYVTKLRGWKSAELPVIWTDDRDSRIKPLRDAIRSFKGLNRVLLNRLAGKY